MHCCQHARESLLPNIVDPFGCRGPAPQTSRHELAEIDGKMGLYAAIVRFQFADVAGIELMQR
jgi:hypothetical protein